MTSFGEEVKGGEIGSKDSLSSLSPFLPSGCSMFPHFCRVRYFLTAGRGLWGRDCVWGWKWMMGAKKDILDFIIHPRRTPPYLAQLSALRFSAEDFQNISRSMFIAKHTESIANCELSVHFTLLPGICPGDPSLNSFQRRKCHTFENLVVSHFRHTVCSLDIYKMHLTMLVTILTP